MIFCLFFHSSLTVLLLVLYSRWLDEETLADICLYSLCIELLLATFNVSYIYYTDSIFFLQCGSILLDNFNISIKLIFCFDELSGFFFGILDFALILCFYFLIEYFEYDSNSTGIILLSALFSHFAMWYFCVFDLFLLILFWESISLISFLLIQHWSYRLPTYKAGIKVFFISQLGDIPLFIFIFLLLNRFGTTDLTEILSQLFLVSFEYILIEKFGCLCNFAGLAAFFLSFALLLKSAQFFFYPWLLDAMEAPVPISAQLHSSTLVIIGFYIYLRFQNLFVLAPAVSSLLLVFGVITVVGASVLGFFQEDGKKLLACSTASQLGYAVTGLSLFYFEESLILMTFCCCNKAFTFIWFGTLMDRCAGVSDFRFISGLCGLSVLEHAGLFMSLANFTILPGAFSWHVKSLFMKGQYTHEAYLTKYALDILSLTWFFSSLYLIYLYLILFLKPIRGVTRGNSSYTVVTPLQSSRNNLLRSRASLLQVAQLLKYAISTLPAHINATQARFIWGAGCATLAVVSRYMMTTPHVAFNYFNVLLNERLTTTTTLRRMSTSFYVLLTCSGFILFNMGNGLFFTYTDFTWLVDSFYFHNFVLIDFYN